jgi:hypothetical protein
LRSEEAGGRSYRYHFIDSILAITMSLSSYSSSQPPLIEIENLPEVSVLALGMMSVFA